MTTRKPHKPNQKETGKAAVMETPVSAPVSAEVATFSFKALAAENPHFVAGFAVYDRMTDKANTDEFRERQNVQTALLAWHERSGKTLREACALFIQENGLDWSLDRLVNLMKVKKSREKAKAGHKDKAAEAMQRAKEAGESPDTVQKAGERAARESKREEAMTRLIKAGISAKQIINMLVIPYLNSLDAITVETELSVFEMALEHYRVNVLPAKIAESTEPDKKTKAA